MLGAARGTALFDALNECGSVTLPEPKVLTLWQLIEPEGTAASRLGQTSLAPLGEADYHMTSEHPHAREVTGRCQAPAAGHVHM